MENLSFHSCFLYFLVRWVGHRLGIEMFRYNFGHRGIKQLVYTDSAHFLSFFLSFFSSLPFKHECD
jgi:hypothetical protein